MKLFGYEISKSQMNVRIGFTDIAQPFFSKGNHIGCVVLHGIGGTPANVRPLADLLASKGFTVYAPTLAGHGETIADLHGKTWQDWVGTVYGAYDRLKEEGCDEIIPFGLSLGGVLSAYLAATKPCRAAFLFSPAVKMKTFLRVAAAMSPIAPFVNYNVEQELKSFKENPYSQMYTGMSTRSVRELGKLQKQLIPILPDISCPVYAVWAGNDDKVDPVSSDILKAGLRVPYKECTVPDCPHGSTYSKERDRVYAPAMEWLTELLDGESGK